MADIYNAAVEGRRTFRELYRRSKAENKRLRDALDRIARFAEAYEETAAAKDYKSENCGWALAVTLGKYARRILS